MPPGVAVADHQLPRQEDAGYVHRTLCPQCLHPVDHREGVPRRRRLPLVPAAPGLGCHGAEPIRQSRDGLRSPLCKVVVVEVHVHDLAVVVVVVPQRGDRLRRLLCFGPFERSIPKFQRELRIVRLVVRRPKE